KFSMAYAALCLREGVPGAVELERWLERVRNNRAVGFLVRYMNCDFNLPVVEMCVLVLSLLPMTEAVDFVLTRGVRGWGALDAMVVLDAFTLCLLALPVLCGLLLNRRAVRSGRVYECLLEGEPPHRRLLSTLCVYNPSK
ncbi:TPA: hypothetical protein HA336_07850, partial [Methanopyrus kandleri]